MKRFVSYTLLSLMFIFSACASSKSVGGGNSKRPGSGPVELFEVSTDKQYAVTPENAVHVGGVEKDIGPDMERKYLNQLAGPDGEKISYSRLGSCCNFETPRGFMGAGLLDIYEITYDGLDEPIKIYIDMYDYEAPLAPYGFTILK